MFLPRGRSPVLKPAFGGRSYRARIYLRPNLFEMTWIKICGITNLEDALDAAGLGVNALGFIFAPSPRRIEPSAAREIIARLPPRLEKVGVFVDEDPGELLRVAAFCGLTAVQLHGREDPDYSRRISLRVIKAIRVKSPESLDDLDKYPTASILLDAWRPDRAGGTGEPFPWEWAGKIRGREFILSGGLHPGNVYEAIRLLRPAGVDVSSGVEIFPGKKDLSKMIEFLKEVKRTDPAG